MLKNKSKFSHQVCDTKKKKTYSVSDSFDFLFYRGLMFVHTDVFYKMSWCFVSRGPAVPLSPHSLQSSAGCISYDLLIQTQPGLQVRYRGTDYLTPRLLNWIYYIGTPGVPSLDLECPTATTLKGAGGVCLFVGNFTGCCVGLCQ